jgi:hypothetical protein
MATTYPPIAASPFAGLNFMVLWGLVGKATRAAPKERRVRRVVATRVR